jgi:probable F420-dependent oxidoreductase
MKIDVELYPERVAEIPSLAKRAEDWGFAGVWMNETRHDSFVQIALAAEGTQKINVGTSIALAFTRSPTSLAYAAWDLQELSQGRLILGLGSQVKGHIERRFGVSWAPPVGRMREVITVLRMVWDRWQSGKPLDFSGKYFRINLMTPFFSPPPLANPKIPIFVAGVNRGMCRLAGELCDGLHVHPLHTIRYLNEVVLKSLESGLRKSGRSREAFEVAASTFVATGSTDSEIREMRERCRSQIAFYASTRTYRPVLELHGWGEVCDRLHQKSVQGLWGEMPSEVTDEMLDEMVICGRWDQLPSMIRHRYSGIADRIRLYEPFDGSAGWKSFAVALGN